MQIKRDHTAAINTFEPHELPSNGVFYETKVTVSRMTPIQVSKMVGVSTGEGGMKTIIDVIDETLDVDARTLTPSDFEFFMFWHAFSLGKGVYDVSWISRQGNANTYSLKWEDVQLLTPKLTKSDYLSLMREGFAVPTVALWEDIATSKTGEDMAWLYDKAQFMSGASWRERVTNLNQKGMDGLKKVVDIQHRALHGIVKVLNLRDELYDAHAEIRDSTIERDTLRANLPYLRDVGTIKVVMRDMMSLNKTIDRLRVLISTGKPITLSESERVSFDIMASDFALRF